MFRQFLDLTVFANFSGSILAPYGPYRCLNNGRRCLQEQLVFVIHPPATIEELAYLDASLCITAPPRAGRVVQDHSSKPHRIIVSYGGLIAEATDPIEIESFGQRPPRRLATRT